MRNSETEKLSLYINKLWRECVEATKEEFMDSIPGVTLDQRSEPAGVYPALGITQQRQYYYCTFIASGRIVECYSYDNGEWYCKY